MDNIAYNCMYRNMICNRLEEYTILYYFLQGNCNGILRCTVVLLKKIIDYSVYLPLNSVKTRRVRRKLVYLWLHTFQGVNSFSALSFSSFSSVEQSPVSGCTLGEGLQRWNWRTEVKGMRLAPRTDTAIQLCHAAAILSQKIKKALFLHG